jgi:hypothetical protein
MGGLSPEEHLLVSAPDLSQRKSGLTSAPRLPHAEQTNRASISDSRTSSGHWSALIAIEWLQW